MRLCFLGTAGYHPNEQRHTSCLMLPAAGFVLDAGSGFFRVRDRIRTPRLNIFLSHAHLDHVCGLNFLLDVVLDKAVEQVVVHGLPRHLDAAVKMLFDSPLFPVAFTYETRPISARFTVEGVQVRTQELDHPGKSVGYRFDWQGRSLAFITDTVCSESYLELIAGVDLLVHECNFPDRMLDWAVQTGHSTISPVLRLARLAGVKRLCLTHVNPLLDPEDPVGLGEATESFPGVIVATDGMEVEF